MVFLRSAECDFARHLNACWTVQSRSVQRHRLSWLLRAGGSNKFSCIQLHHQRLKLPPWHRVPLTSFSRFATAAATPGQRHSGQSPPCSAGNLPIGWVQYFTCWTAFKDGSEVSAGPEYGCQDYGWHCIFGSYLANVREREIHKLPVCFRAQLKVLIHKWIPSPIQSCMHSQIIIRTSECSSPSGLMPSSTECC